MTNVYQDPFNIEHSKKVEYQKTLYDQHKGWWEDYINKGQATDYNYFALPAA